MAETPEVNSFTTLNVISTGRTARSRWRYKDLTLLEGIGEVARLEEEYGKPLEAERNVS